MPEPEHPHTHPDYEATFARIATILDVMAEEQLEQQRLLKETQNTLQQWIAYSKERDAETTDKLKETQNTLQQWIAQSKERDAETTDKLNALIDLVDRHIRES